MDAPAQRSTGQRLRPILLGLVASVFAFWALYLIALLVGLTFFMPD